jgi:Na+-driven multidrug efflux pump
LVSFLQQQRQQQKVETHSSSFFHKTIHHQQHHDTMTAPSSGFEMRIKLQLLVFLLFSCCWSQENVLVVYAFSHHPAVSSRLLAYYYTPSITSIRHSTLLRLSVFHRRQRKSILWLMTKESVNEDNVKSSDMGENSTITAQQEEEEVEEATTTNNKKATAVATTATNISSNITTTTTTTSSSNVDYQWTKQTFAIATPALIGMMADPLLSLMDTGYVGRLGKTPLAALGPCTSIFHLSFNAFRATTAATTSLVATSLQKGKDSGNDNDRDRGKDVARQVTAISLKLGFCIGMGVLITLLCTGRLALAAMGVGESSTMYTPACAYLFTRLWAAPAVLCIGVAEGAFRGYGNTITPLIASLTASVINLVLDPLFIFKQGFGWGVRGAAAATVLSQLGAAAYYAHQLLKRGMLPPMPWSKNNNIKSSSSTAALLVEVADTTTSSSSRDGRIPTISGDNINGSGTSSDTTIIKKSEDSDLEKSSPRSGGGSGGIAGGSGVVRSILAANVAMWTKQGSLLLGWAYASARATRLGEAHVAAHQVALSVWLVFAFVLDAAGVASQVLMGRAYAKRDDKAVSSLIYYMMKFALLQGLLSMLCVDALDLFVPRIFTTDPMVQKHLHTLMPPLAFQQLLVSLTLVTESLAIGASQFSTLAFGTAVATIASVYQLSRQTTVEGIWNVGIVTLFAGRLVTACAAVIHAKWKLQTRNRQEKPQQQQHAQHVEDASVITILE